MRLIGITGLMGSGKDTTFTFIQDHHPKAQRAAFADKLKIIAALAIGYSPDEDIQTLLDAMNECKKEWTFRVDKADHGDLSASWRDARRMSVTGFTGRQYLQWLGANAREVFGDTFWIDQVLPHPGFVFGNMAEEVEAKFQEKTFWETHYPTADLVVVTDVRYPNEAERIRSLGGEVWEILRPGLSSDGHSSETPLPRQLIDRVIENDGTLEDLSRKVKEALDAQQRSTTDTRA